jgi:peroxin-6
MLEPVLQGYAQKGETRFIVTAGDLSTDGKTQNHSELDIEEESESDREGIEIDEGFLASSILPPMFDSPTPASLVSSVSRGNGHTNVDDSPTESSTSPSSFRPEPLSEPVSVLWDDCTLYLRTADLGRIGVLNGDWVS